MHSVDDLASHGAEVATKAHYTATPTPAGWIITVHRPGRPSASTVVGTEGAMNRIRQRLTDAGLPGFIASPGAAVVEAVLRANEQKRRTDRAVAGQEQAAAAWAAVTKKGKRA